MKVKILCQDCGENQTDALFASGGLAITGMHLMDCSFSDRYFTVTHVGTGRKLASGLTLVSAKLLLNRLLELTDWQRPPSEIYAECRARSRAWVLNALRLLREFDADA